MNRNTVSGYVPLVHCCNTVKCVQMSKYDFNYVRVDFHKNVLLFNLLLCSHLDTRAHYFSSAKKKICLQN